MTLSMWWLLPAFMLGGSLGFLVCALLTASARADARARIALQNPPDTDQPLAHPA